MLATDKNNADVQHNEGLSLLTLGDYRRGFQKYEARWLRTGMPRRRSFGKALWLGEYPLARKTVLVHAEQGLGDTIQFARYAPQLARSGAKVVLEVQPSSPRCCRASKASRAWSAAAMRCPLTTCIAQPAACRWRCVLKCRPFRRTCRISRRARNASPNGASARAPAVAAHRGRVVGPRGSRQ